MQKFQRAIGLFYFQLETVPIMVAATQCFHILNLLSNWSL